MLPRWARIFYGILLVIIIAITGWAIAAPFLQYSSNGVKVDEYLTKQCVNSACASSNNSNIVKYGGALLGLYILVIVLCILAGVSILLQKGNMRKIIFTCMIFIFFTIIILLNISKHQSPTPNITNAGNASNESAIYEFSSSSIGMLVIICVSILAIILQFTYGFLSFDIIRDVIFVLLK